MDPNPLTQTHRSSDKLTVMHAGKKGDGEEPVKPLIQ
jgi:hypothetical protein